MLVYMVKIEYFVRVEDAHGGILCISKNKRRGLPPKY